MKVLIVNYSSNGTFGALKQLFLNTSLNTVQINKIQGVLRRTSETVITQI